MWSPHWGVMNNTLPYGVIINTFLTTEHRRVDGEQPRQQVGKK